MSLRTILTDNLWKRLADLLERTGRVYNKPEHRNTVEGILYRIRTGCPLRDLPAEFGLWNTIYRRFNLWSKKGIWQEVLKSFRQHIDSEWIFIDGNIIKAPPSIRQLILMNTKAVPIIPRRRNSKVGNDDIDWCLYRYRHLIENTFAFLKQYRAITTRYDKLARNYAASLAMIYCIRWGEVVVWLRFKLKRSTYPNLALSRSKSSKHCFNCFENNENI
uniref:Transposase, IS4 family n=1 Tax=Glaesserella parasuis TaxID=738 RepID=T1RPM2_GLAPU|nr:transposase, IS4 family [Glaesserella parasuis]